MHAFDADRRGYPGMFVCTVQPAATCDDRESASRRATGLRLQQFASGRLPMPAHPATEDEHRAARRELEYPQSIFARVRGDDGPIPGILV